MNHIIANKEYNGHGLYRDVEIVLPSDTIRLLFRDGVTPSFSKGNATQVSETPNVWDLTNNGFLWDYGCANQPDLLKVLGANLVSTEIMFRFFNNCSALDEVKNFKSTKVTSMSYLFDGCLSLKKVPELDYYKNKTFAGMFANCKSLSSIPNIDTSNATGPMYYMFKGCSTLTGVPLLNMSGVNNTLEMFKGCTSLKSVPLLDISNVTNMGSMFEDCTTLTSIPLFNTTNVTSISYAFSNCYNVQSGALSLYNQISTQESIPGHYNTFRNCGVSSQVGSAELAQIPSDWK